MLLVEVKTEINTNINRTLRSAKPLTEKGLEIFKKPIILGGNVEFRFNNKK